MPSGVHTRRPHATRAGWAQRRAHVVEIEFHSAVFTAGPTAAVATTRSAAQPKDTANMSPPPPPRARGLPVAMHRAACAREPARRYSQISAPSIGHLPKKTECLPCRPRQPLHVAAGAPAERKVPSGQAGVRMQRAVEVHGHAAVARHQERSQKRGPRLLH